MQFKTFITAALVSAAPLMAAAQSSCPEASRFGDVTVTPTTFAPGDVRSLSSTALDTSNSSLRDFPQAFSIRTDFTCSFSRGIVPKFIDYFLAVPQNNNGHEPALLLGRHDFSGSASSPIDTVSGTVRRSPLALGVT
jgi:hypothetical protein